MRRIRLIVSYDGTNYCGWQIQENAVTVEGTLTGALRKWLKEDIEIIGARIPVCMRMEISLCLTQTAGFRRRNLRLDSIIICRMIFVCRSQMRWNRITILDTEIQKKRMSIQF